MCTYKTIGGFSLFLLLTIAKAVQLSSQVIGECGATEFRCSSGSCIESQQRCNRKLDCPHGSDEVDCDQYQQLYSTFSHHIRAVNSTEVDQGNSENGASKCGATEFQCFNGQCIHECSLYDEIDDCGDGSDEQERQCPLENEPDLRKIVLCTRKAQQELKSVVSSQTLEIKELQKQVEDLKRVTLALEARNRTTKEAAFRPSPSPPGSPVATTMIPTITSCDDNDNVQTNSSLLQRLQGLVLSLQNQTENSQSYNETKASILELSIQFRSSLECMGYGFLPLANDSNQAQENLQRALARLDRIGQSVTSLKEKVVENILKAFKNDRNDLVKSLLNNLTKENQLDSFIPEIIRGMFDGNINNYKKIIALFQSAKRGQFKSGLTSLIDLFHNTSSTSSSSKTARGNSYSYSNSIIRPLLDEPEYLNLAYLTKTEFGTEFKSKFPSSVQNLVFAKKVCVRNLMTNFYLSVDKDEGLKDGGYSVSTRKQSTNFPLAVLCDWEIVPRDGGASFIILRKSQAETLTLNVMEGSVFAESDDYNPAYFWKIQLRENAQEMTLQNVAARSKNPSYFLCSIRALNKAERAVPRRGLELLESGGTACKWAIRPPQ